METKQIVESQKTIMMTDEITTESVTTVINAIVEYNNTNAVSKTKGQIKLYFSSTGGYIAPAAVFIDFLNSYKYDNLTMIAYQDLLSSGFNVFFSINNDLIKRKILDNCHCMGLIHTPTYCADVRLLNDRVGYEKKMHDDIKKTSKNYIREVKSLNFLTKKELSLLTNGKDVIVTKDTLIDLVDRNVHMSAFM